MHWFSKFKIFQKYVSSFNYGSNFKLQIDDDSIIKEELGGNFSTLLRREKEKNEGSTPDSTIITDHVLPLPSNFKWIQIGACDHAAAAATSFFDPIRF